MCVCSLRYLAWNAHAPYCHLWPAPLYSVFPHNLQTARFSKNKFLNIKCVFWFSVPLLSETFLILKRTEGDMIKTVHWSSCKVPLLVFMYSTRYWSSCIVPVIGLHVKYRYWSSCIVPVIGLYVKYRYWSSCKVPVIGLYVKYPLLVFM
jgi:hypothetical protein